MLNENGIKKMKNCYTKLLFSHFIGLDVKKYDKFLLCFMFNFWIKFEYIHENFMLFIQSRTILIMSNQYYIVYVWKI